jgi:hypothetical protein
VNFKLHHYHKLQAVALALQDCYGFLMVRKMIGEAHDLLRTTTLSEERSQRAYESLAAAMHLADSLLEKSSAATLGAKGGKQTSKNEERMSYSVVSGQRYRTPTGIIILFGHSLR